MVMNPAGAVRVHLPSVFDAEVIGSAAGKCESVGVQKFVGVQMFPLINGCPGIANQWVSRLSVGVQTFPRISGCPRIGNQWMSKTCSS